MAERLGASVPARRNLAARMGLWSARHRKLAIFGWLAAVLLVFALGNLVGTKTLSDADAGVGESGRADRIYASGGFDSGGPESVLVQSSSVNVRDAAFRAAVAAVAGAVEREPGVSELRSRTLPATRARSPAAGTLRSSSSASERCPTLTGARSTSTPF